MSFSSVQDQLGAAGGYQLRIAQLVQPSFDVEVRPILRVGQQDRVDRNAYAARVSASSAARACSTRFAEPLALALAALVLRAPRCAAVKSGTTKLDTSSPMKRPIFNALAW